MAGIKWGKFSGKNRGATCNNGGGKSRKCERSKAKDSGKGKEGNQGIKRGLFHSLCSKSCVIDDAVIEIKGDPHLCSNSLQEEEMVAQRTDACNDKSKHNDSVLGVTAKTDVCKNSLDIPAIKATLGSQSVHRKKLGACEKDVDGEIEEDGSAKCEVDRAVDKCTCVREGTAEYTKQGTCDYECMGDVKQGKREIECKEDTKQQDVGDVSMKQCTVAMEQGGNMVHVELNSSVKEEKGIDSPAKCIHKDEDATKAADKGLNCESTQGMRSKPDIAEMEQKDVYVSAGSELVMSPHGFVSGISKKAMADPVVIASGLTFERVYIQAWIDAGNTRCPVTRRPLSHLELIPNLTLKAVISTWHSRCRNPRLKSADHRFASCVSSFSSCPDGTPELRAASIHNFLLMPSSAGSPSSSWDQGEHEIGTPKHHDSTNSMLQFEKACIYLVSRIKSLVSDLESEYLAIQRSAAAELRLLAKLDDSKRLLIAGTGALRPLVALVWSRDRSVQLEATTAVLNLSLNHFLRDAIVKEGAIGALVGVLRDGSGAVAAAKENAAMTLACLAHSDQHKIKIGLAGAVKPLVNLLERGSARGKKDAAAALYRLSAHDLNKCRIVRAGASRPLVGYMSDEQDKDGMADKAIAILGNLVSVEEGRVAFVEEKGISSLMQVLRTGSERSKRLAVCILSQLCTRSSKHRSLVLQKKPFPTLMALSKIGNIRHKMQVAEVIQALIVDAD